jgi:hypothetical protein
MELHLAVFTHPDGLAAANLGLDLPEKFHSRTAGREISLELAIPLSPVSLCKPLQEGRLLFGRQRLYGLLDLCDLHTYIVPSVVLTGIYGNPITACSSPNELFPASPPTLS